MTHFEITEKRKRLAEMPDKELFEYLASLKNCNNFLRSEVELIREEYKKHGKASHFAILSQQACIEYNTLIIRIIQEEQSKREAKKIFKDTIFDQVDKFHKTQESRAIKMLVESVEACNKCECTGCCLLCLELDMQHAMKEYLKEHCKITFTKVNGKMAFERENNERRFQ